MNLTRSLWLLLSLALTSGCDLSKQAQAKTVAVSTILSTPPVSIRAEAIAGNGFDASIPEFDAGGFDAGFLNDAGVLFLADAGIVLPAQNLAFVFFGTRNGDGFTTAPTGIEGATATLTQVSGPTFTLDDQGKGTYALSLDAGFVYVDDATYQFTFVAKSTTYVAEVKNVPPREDIAEFHPAAGYIDLAAGEEFSFIRPDPPADRDRNYGFVNVFPVSQNGQGQPTYTNIPMTALDFLKLVAFPKDWTSTRVTIPGSAFPDPDSNYLIVLQSAKLGGPKSDNLFAGSAILAGTAEIAIVKTRK